MPANFKQEEINLREVANEVCGLNEKVAENTQALMPLQAYAGRNLLINGDFSVWQRGTSFTGTSSSAGYKADHWFSGSNRTVTTSLNIPDGILSSRSYYILGLSGTVPEVRQGIELFEIGKNAPLVKNRDYTLSFYALAAAGANIAIRVQFAAGVNGTGDGVILPLGTVVGVGTGAWQKIEYTFNTDSISAGASTATLELLIRAELADSELMVVEVQLELGSHATEFEYVDPATQLARCQRYYYLARTIFYIGIQGTEAYPCYNFPTEMRTHPTLSYTLDNLTGTLQSHYKGIFNWLTYSGSGSPSINDLTADAEL